MRNSHSHAQRVPVGRAARAVTSAALASAAVSATLWSAGADAAALLCAEAGLFAAVAACRVWGRPAERGERTDRGERAERAERAERSDRAGRAEHAERAADGSPASGSAPAAPAAPAGPAATTAWTPGAAAPPSAPDQTPDREAAAAFVGIARRIQATVNQELHDLRRMQDRHGDAPEVFGDLLRLDHGVSLIGRLADSLAVLGGAEPGRRRTRPVELLDVVRGAMSRIVEYARVDVDVPADPAVAATAVEPVVHALAELLDNATRYSPPDTRVRVGAEYASAPGGDGVELVIFVDDAGVGLNPATRRSAMRALAGDTENDPVRPGGPPRLGLTVVGRLARSTGFQAAVAPGLQGGTRATLRLPSALVTARDPDRLEPAGVGSGIASASASAAASATASGAAPVSASASASAVAAGGVTWSPAPQTSNPARRPAPRPSPHDPNAVGPSGLPQRRRATAAPSNAVPVTATTENDRPAGGAGLWLGAFMGGKDGGRS